MQDVDHHVGDVLKIQRTGPHHQVVFAFRIPFVQRKVVCETAGRQQRGVPEFYHPGHEICGHTRKTHYNRLVFRQRIGEGEERELDANTGGRRTHEITYS